MLEVMQTSAAMGIYIFVSIFVQVSGSRSVPESEKNSKHSNVCCALTWFNFVSTFQHGLGRGVLRYVVPRVASNGAEVPEKG